MKDENKNRLKKLGKVTAYCLGLFAMLLLGVGLGNCSAKDKPVKANAETGLVLADHKTLRPKRALDPAQYPTLDPVSGNLLYTALGGHYNWASVTGGGFRFYTDQNIDMYLVDITAGYYSFDCVYPEGSTAWAGTIAEVTGDSYTKIKNLLNGVTSPENTFVNDGFSQVGSLVGGLSRQVIRVTAEWEAFLLRITHGSHLRVTLLNSLDSPALASYSLPLRFNPYAVSGTYRTDLLASGPAVTEGTQLQTNLYNLKGCLFRSNGMIFDKIAFDFTYKPNQYIGHWDAGGGFVSDGVIVQSSSNPSYYCADMLYMNTETNEAVKVWSASFVSSGNDLFLVAGGQWLSAGYRQIDVLQWRTFTKELPTSSLGLDWSMEDWLKYLAVEVTKAVADGISNPFTLLKEGFVAVGGILSIQILPFMTLGTLVFVPLVVLVILAILKLLAK